MECDFCKKDMSKGESCICTPIKFGGKEYQPIKLGEEQTFKPANGGAFPHYIQMRKVWDECIADGYQESPCHDCNTPLGGYHHPGCDNERCPICGGQLISCDCEFDLEEDDKKLRLEIEVNGKTRYDLELAVAHILDKLALGDKNGHDENRSEDYDYGFEVKDLRGGREFIFDIEDGEDEKHTARCVCVKGVGNVNFYTKQTGY